MSSQLKKPYHYSTLRDETWYKQLYIHFVYIIRLSNIFMIKHKKNHVNFIEFIIWRKVSKEGLLLLHVIQTIAKYEYFEIFLTEIPQYLQRRHWGFPAFLTYDVTKEVPTKVDFVSHMYVIQRFVSHRLYLLAK
jgi:hypothetical protein